MTDEEAFFLLHHQARMSSARVLPLLREGAKAADFFNADRVRVWVEQEKLDPNTARTLLSEPCQISPGETFSRLKRQGFSSLVWSDPLYPASLREIYDPPLFLYMEGSLLPEDACAVALVGSRHPTLYGERIAGSYSHALAQRGLTIVSGFAQGIDRCAHEGALSADGGRTVAVLGCGLEVSYPKAHRALRERVRAQGALLSEFPLDWQPRGPLFPKRNRVIAGMAMATVVVEAALRSGSLVTARLALEAGREAYAVPGPVDSMLSEGTNRLIADGARPLLSPQDLIEDLAPILKRFLQARSSEPLLQPVGPRVEETTSSRDRDVKDHEPERIPETLRPGDFLASVERWFH